MKRIVVNKNFNTRFLSRSIKESLVPDGQTSVDRSSYNYVGTGQTNHQTWVIPARWFIVTKSYLDLIDKVNSLSFDRIVYYGSSIDDYEHRFFNYLTAYNKEERMKGFQHLLNYGLITNDEMEIARNSCEAFSQVKSDSITWDYNTEFDYYTMKHVSPLHLENRWDNSLNNLDNEQLFIFTLLESSAYNNGWECIESWYINDQSGNRFFNIENNTYSLQLSYMAHTLTDRSGDGDIQFDYIDKIDYLDSLELSIKLPKEIS